MQVKDSYAKGDLLLHNIKMSDVFSFLRGMSWIYILLYLFTLYTNYRGLHIKKEAIKIPGKK